MLKFDLFPGKNNIFPGTFTVTGDVVNRQMNGHFSVDSTIQAPIIKKNGYITNTTDITSTGVFGQTGTITQKINGVTTAIQNAKVVVKKDGYIVDKSKTDNNGNYLIFVESGKYDIEISSSAYNRKFKNYQITSGITEVHVDIISGQIHRRFHDVVLFSKSNSLSYENLLINGTIFDPRHDPVSKTEIVITKNNEVVVYHKTTDDGQYHFLLPYGTYDVRIRLPLEHIKIAQNVNFSGEDGFLNKVVYLAK